MAENTKQFAERLGATVIAQVPHTGGGTFGAARLAKCVSSLQANKDRVIGSLPCDEYAVGNDADPTGDMAAPIRDGRNICP